MATFEEMRWRSELDQHGHSFRDMPVHWYRHTPKQALLSKIGIINLILAPLINFGVNVAMIYAFNAGKSYVGLYNKNYIPSDADINDYDSTGGPLLLSIYLMCFLTPFVNTILSTAGLRDALRKGELIPVDAECLNKGVWRLFPLHVKGTFKRSLAFGMYSAIIFGTVILIIYSFFCGIGAMYGSGSTCASSKTASAFIFPLFAAIVAEIMFIPFFLSSINSGSLPSLEHTLFMSGQESRWNQKRKDEVNDYITKNPEAAAAAGIVPVASPVVAVP
jgi:hypothetical protein